MVQKDFREDVALEEFSFAELAARDPATIKRLTHVCETIGFFVVVDHPVDAELLSDTFRAYSDFFELPDDVKKRYHHSKQVVWPQTSRGYSAMSEELLGSEGTKDFKEFFDTNVDRPLEPGVPFTGPNVIPSDDVSPGFSAVVRMLEAVCDRVFWPVVRALSTALGLDPHALDDIMDKPYMNQRGTIYPASGGSAQAHTDNGMFTLLFLEDRAETDGDRSLQVRSQGEWKAVRGASHKIVVNLGDHVWLLSNSRFVSTLHRVQHKGKTSRKSIAIGVYPNIHAEFAPIGGCERNIVKTRDVMLANFKNLWDEKKGNGRSLSAAEQAALVE